jgi:hypothetical protein
MIGAVVFVISFVLFLLISLGVPGIPPGNTILNALVPDLYNSAVDPMYQQLAEGIINGVIFGVIIWVIFTIAKMFYDRMQGPKEVVVNYVTLEHNKNRCAFRVHNFSISPSVAKHV